jgi:membrane protease subunit (stomatin/prohibitin family)
MAIIDIVKYQAQEDEFVWKFPSEDLRIGTQVIVNTSQYALFVKGGEILDGLKNGTHNIKTDNIIFFLIDQLTILKSNNLMIPNGLKII